MEFKNLLIQKREKIAVVTINRPKVLNALNSETLMEIGVCFDELNKDDSVKIVILTGSGEKSFVAGADISQMATMTALESRAFGKMAQGVMDSIENSDKIVIAAVNGFALGGGSELALACDIRIASDKAKFGQPEVGLGIIPFFGGTQRLSRVVGKGMSKYIILSGQMISAEEAYRIGLVQKVVSAEALIDSAITIAEQILKNGPIAVNLAKEAINNGLNVDLPSGLKLETELSAVAFATEDQKEGMAAFLEKRPADFKNK